VPEENAMTVLTAALMGWLAAVPAERPAIVVQAQDAPVRLDRATVLQGTEGPPVVLYSATNLTDAALEQFTVMAFVFDPNGALKARQVAPGRRTLDPRETKYSTLVLDGSPLEPGYVIVIGANQAQRVGTDVWWHTDLQPAAEAAVPLKKR
jgi:hypothetical protein